MPPCPVHVQRVTCLQQPAVLPVQPSYDDACAKHREALEAHAAAAAEYEAAVSVAAADSAGSPAKEAPASPKPDGAAHALERPATPAAPRMSVKAVLGEEADGALRAGSGVDDETLAALIVDAIRQIDRTKQGCAC